MPSEINNVIASELVNEEWFQSQRTSKDLPSDNWRIVRDQQGRRGLLYVMRFASASGMPKRIPNDRNAFRRLTELSRTHARSECGPFIAFAEVSDSTATPDIVAIWVWDVSTKLSSKSNTLRVSELGEPAFQF